MLNAEKAFKTTVFLACRAIWLGTYVPIFQINLLLLSSRQKEKLSGEN